MKFLTLITLSLLLLSACTSQVTEPTPSVDQSSQNVVQPLPKSDACSKLDISIIDAEWAKPPFHQEPHKLKIVQVDGTHTEYILGIDRSPDIFFKIENLSAFRVRYQNN